MNNVFGFEQDFAGSLRCIPIAVRFKLDASGIKLSLRQWSRFTREDRAQLLTLSCDNEAATAAYRTFLTALIIDRAGEIPRDLTMDPAPDWSDPWAIPQQVVSYARECGAPPLSLAQWAALSALQRYALVKLSRGGHDNVNFVPALREFGLTA
jgi:hypothetical protein